MLVKYTYLISTRQFVAPGNPKYNENEREGEREREKRRKKKVNGGIDDLKKKRPKKKYKRCCFRRVHWYQFH